MGNFLKAYSLFDAFKKLVCYYSNINASNLVFSAKACFKVVVRSIKYP